VKRPIRADEQRLWSVVAATVHPRPGRTAPKPPEAEIAMAAEPAPGPAPAVRTRPKGPPPRPKPPPASPPSQTLKPIEPRRKRRIVRERDDIEGRIDLHGMDQDRARAALHGFLLNAYDRGLRAVLVITGKGTLGDGILRKRTPDWLAEAPIRQIVAGVSEAARHHGGGGALYVALKRKT
jgi:DNA-nicking Smr family endonuclease